MKEYRDYQFSSQSYYVGCEMAPEVSVDRRVEWVLSAPGAVAAPAAIHGLLSGLRTDIQSLEQAIKELTTALGAAAAPEAARETNETAVLVREIPREEARAEILALFGKSGETLCYGDVAGILGLDLRLVVELCDELEEEGKIVGCQAEDA